MEIPKLIPLLEKDIKRLKRYKLITFIFYIYMILVSLGMFGFTIWLYFFDDEVFIGPIMGIATLLGVYVIMRLYRYWRKLKSDHEQGIKEVIQGEITNKYSVKNSHEFTINDTKYKVNFKDYIRFKKGEHVLISYTPASKIILDIHELPQRN